MSALLPLSRAFLLFADSLREARGELDGPETPEIVGAWLVLDGIANAAQATCEKLRIAAQAECSGKAGETFKPPIPEDKPRRAR